MENYICINGKKAELTEEQLKALGIELPKTNPFERVKRQKPYYMISAHGKVRQVRELGDMDDIDLHRVANYCADSSLMEQRALYETLSRLLWRYSMEHDGDKIDWDDRNSKKAFIYYNHATKHFDVDSKWDYNYIGTVYFDTTETAQNAIKEVIEPFMQEHPEFKW